MTEFVVDASIVCSWVLPDENSSVARSAFEALQTSNGVAPDLLWHEVRNVLILAHRRKRIGFDIVIEGFDKLKNLGVVIYPIVEDALILNLAERHGLTAYDAVYLALAIERQLPFATLDKQLAAAAIRESVPLIS